jgi:hypothetical protein
MSGKNPDSLLVVPLERMLISIYFTLHDKMRDLTAIMSLKQASERTITITINMHN